MTAKVINDPSSLGWEYDPETGRWTWGGGSSSGGGDGTFPEAPVDGEQYARQDAGWAVIVHPEGGGDGTIGTITTADVKLTNPTLRSPVGLDTQEDANTYFYGELGKLIDEDGNVIGGGGGIEDAPSDGAIYGRKNADWVVVPTSGGGDGPDMSAYYTAAQCDNKFQPKGNYDNYSGWNIKASGGTAQKVTKNYTVDFVGAGNTTVTRSGATITISSTGLTSYTETDPVFKASPAGSITQNDINKWNNPPSGGNDYDGSDAVKLTGDQTIAGRKTFSARLTTTTGEGFVCGGNIDGAGWIKSKGDMTAYQFVIDSSRASAIIGLAGKGRVEVSTGAAKLLAGTGQLSVQSGSATVTGNLSATGTITGTDCIATSDERLKKNVEPVKAGVITQLEGVDFQWIQNDVKASGFIAQQVEEIPELSHLVHQTDEQGHKGVSYMGMIPYLLAEIKSLRDRVEELENA